MFIFVSAVVVSPSCCVNRFKIAENMFRKLPGRETGAAAEEPDGVTESAEL